MNMNLRSLKLSDKAAFLSALSENWENNFVFAHYYESLASLSFEKYIEVLPMIAQGLLIPRDHVPSTLLFAFDDQEELVGRVSIRHVLTPELLCSGGHVGYGVVPSRRRQGFASEILRQTILYVREELPQLTKVLLTCDDSNLGSQKTIEKNGGILENLFQDSSMPVPKRRYWIHVEAL